MFIIVRLSVSLSASKISREVMVGFLLDLVNRQTTDKKRLVSNVFCACTLIYNFVHFCLFCRDLKLVIDRQQQRLLLCSCKVMQISNMYIYTRLVS